MIISGKLSGENHPNYGKHLSEKTKQNISDSLTGKHYHTEESKQKLRDSRLKQIFPTKTTKPITTFLLPKILASSLLVFFIKLKPRSFYRGLVY